MSDFHKFLCLVESTTLDTWEVELFRLANSYGFQNTIFGIVPNKNCPLENAFITSNYSREWRETYDNERFHYIDPTVSHCLSSCTPLVWEPKCFKSDNEKCLYEEASGYGIRSGVTFPIHGPNGEFGVVSFVSDALPNKSFMKNLSDSISSLSLLRDYIFESSRKFVKGYESGSDKVVNLTSREQECLKWVMIGKSSWEISMILCCAEATVNFHMANIREKFNVGTRKQALVKAIQLGILTPSYY